MPDSFTAADVAVVLDLDHGRPADLQIRLTSPDGRRVTLVDRSPASLSQATFRPAALAGASARGVWVLEIFDLAAGVSGTLWQASLSLWRELVAQPQRPARRHATSSAMRATLASAWSMIDVQRRADLLRRRRS